MYLTCHISSVENYMCGKKNHHFSNLGLITIDMNYYQSCYASNLIRSNTPDFMKNKTDSKYYDNHMNVVSS